MGYSLTQVDYDPFEDEPEELEQDGFKLTPVDYNPFEGEAPEKGFGGRIADAWKTGQLQSELGLLRADQLLGKETPEVAARVDEIKQSMPVKEDIKRSLPERAVSAAAEMMPIQLEGMKQGLQRGLTLGMGAAGITALAGQAGPQIATPEEIITVPAAFGGMFGVGMVSGTLENIGKIEAGLAYDELLDLKDDQGNRLNPTIAKGAAASVGIINGLLETSQVGLLLKTIPGGQKLLSGIVNKTLKEAVIKGTLKKIALRHAAKYGEFIALETGQEIAQETTNILMDEISKKLDAELYGSNIPAATRKEIIDRLVDTAEQSALAFSVMGAPGTTVSAGIDVSRRNVGEDKDMLDPSKPSSAEKRREEILSKTFEGLRAGEITLDHVAKMRETIPDDDPLSTILDEIFFKQGPAIPGEENIPTEQPSPGVVEPIIPPVAEKPTVAPIQQAPPVTEKPKEPISEVDIQAHEAATSPANDLPEPTDAQKRAGNFKKAHIKGDLLNIKGMDITIENPKGSIRTELRPENAPEDWEPSFSNEMKSHYGYFAQTEGKDGDQIDVFVGPNPKANRAYIVDQVDPETGDFDESKVMMGFNSLEEAKQGYLDNYEEGWQGLGAITDVPIIKLKSWLKKGRQKQAFSKEVQNAESIRKNEGQVQVGRNERQGSETKGVKNLQQKQEAGAKAGDEGQGLEIPTFGTFNEVKVEKPKEKQIGQVKAYVDEMGNQVLELPNGAKLEKGVDSKGKTYYNVEGTLDDLEGLGLGEDKDGLLELDDRKLREVFKKYIGEPEAEPKQITEGPTKEPKVHIQKALSENKPVPASVLADYPELSKPPVKEPWEMTKDEWRNKKSLVLAEGLLAGDNGTASDAMGFHVDLIRKALSEGKPVPKEVLADYLEPGKPPAKESHLSSEERVEKSPEMASSSIGQLYTEKAKQNKNIASAIADFFSEDMTPEKKKEALAKIEKRIEENKNDSVLVAELNKYVNLLRNKAIKKEPKKTEQPLFARKERVWWKDSLGGDRYGHVTSDYYAGDRNKVNVIDEKTEQRHFIDAENLSTKKPESEEPDYSDLQEAWEKQFTQAGKFQIAQALGWNKSTSTRLSKTKWNYLSSAAKKILSDNRGKWIDTLVFPKEEKPKVSSKRLKDNYPREEGTEYENQDVGKDAFMADARSYLVELNKALGWDPDATKQSKVGITKNPGGIAVGGEVTGIFWKPGSEYGIYINIENESTMQNYGRNSNESGTVIMYRAATKDKKYGSMEAGMENRWDAPYNISIEDFIEKIETAVDQAEQYKKPTTKPSERKASDIAGMPEEEIDSVIDDIFGPEEPAPTVKALAKKAGVEAVEGVKEAVKGLSELFTPKNTFSSGLVFDEDTYAKAKPHFEAALKSAIEAGHTVGDLVKHLYNEFGDVIRPYLKRFLTETAQKPLTTGEKEPIISKKEADNETVVAPTTEGPKTGRPSDRESKSGSILETPPVIPAGKPSESNLETVSKEPEKAGRKDIEGGTKGKPIAGDTAEKGGIGTRPDRGSRNVKGGGTEREPGAGTAGTAVGTAIPKTSPMERKPESELPEEDRNHVIEKDDVIFPAGDETKIKANIKAIRLLKKLESENRNPSKAEKKILAQYVGWGQFAQKVFHKKFDDYLKRNADNSYTPERWFYGSDIDKYNKWLRKYGSKLHPKLNGLLTQEEWDSAVESTLNAHYTSENVIKFMWTMAEQMGFKGGTILEPAIGVGHFFGLMPKSIAKNASLLGVDIDSLSARISQKLYPQARIQEIGFEKAKGIPDNSVDLVITNVPFGSFQVYDNKHKDYTDWSIHNYFFARSIDAVRPGGLVMGITSHWTLDATTKGKVREYLGNKADLIAAIRLPYTAFKKDAGTEVVTDILIFRKKDDKIHGLGQDFRLTVDVPSSEKDKTVVINEYFKNHPEMALGKHSTKGTMRGGEDEYTLLPSGDIDEMIGKAIELLPTDIAGEGAKYVEEEKTYAGIDAKEGVLTEKDGNLYIVEDGVLVTPKLYNSKGKLVPAINSDARMKRAKRYIRIREKTKTLIDRMQEEDATDDEIADLRKDLNRVYDKFVSKFGNIGSTANSFLRKTDNEFPIVDSLEDENINVIQTDKGPKKVITYTKASILNKRTIWPFKEPESAESLDDAIKLSRIYRSTIDLEYISNLIGLDQDEVKADMLKHEKVYLNPANGLLEPPDVYLSGNVKEKLERVKTELSENQDLKRNIKALENIQPDDLDIQFIHFKLGSSWIPNETIQDFLLAKMGVRASVIQARTKETSGWSIDVTSGERDAKNTSTWGTSRRAGHKLVQDCLNLKRSQVIDYWYEDGQHKQQINKEETVAAQQKQHEIQAEFLSWAREHEKWGGELAKKYNAEFNGMVLRKFDVPDIDHFPGASAAVKLRDLQKKAVYRCLQESTLLSYGVGTGKTYTYITLAMEMRRIKTARKPLIVVQNATIRQYAKDFRRLYPQAKILIPLDNQRKGKQRKKLLSQIATGDWDAVVLPHSFFDGIADDPEREAAFIREYLDELEQAITEFEASEGNGSFTVKEMKALRKRKTQKLERLLDRRKDNALLFEQLGIDALLIDEAHAYKRSEFFTKMGNVKGIDQGSAQRSTSLLLKANYIRQKTGGKNIILATGTPISNTTAELWTMMRYIRPDILEEYNVELFDDFAANFGDTSIATEETESGTFKEVERFNKYVNGPELLTMFHTVSDVVLTQDAGLDLPNIRTGKPESITVERGEALTEFIDRLREERAAWENLTGREKRLQRHVPLVLFGRAKKAAIDLRLVDPNYYHDDPKSKLNTVINNTFEIWKDTKEDRSTQVLFLDSYRDSTGAFNAYEDMRDKLIKKGVPSKEIIIVKDANDIQREAWFQDIKEGKARIIIGSTQRLGIGVNIQDKLIAAHNIDAPPRPMDIEQRIGRIVREKNENDEVMIFSYGVKNTLDSVMYDRLTKKQKFINQMLRGDIEGRTFDEPMNEEQVSFAEMNAAFAGNPLLFEKTDAEIKIRNLNIAHNTWERKISKAIKDAKNIKNVEIPNTEDEVKNAERRKKIVEENIPSGKVEKVVYDNTELETKDFLDQLAKETEKISADIVSRFKGMSTGDYAKIEDKLEHIYKINAKFNNFDLNIIVNPDIDFQRKNITKNPSKKVEIGYTSHLDSTGKIVKDEKPIKDYQVTIEYNGEIISRKWPYTTGGIFQAFQNRVKDILAEPDNLRQKIEKLKEEQAELEKLSKEPFKQKQELADAVKRLSEIEAELTGAATSETAKAAGEKVMGEAEADEKHETLLGKLRNEVAKLLNEANAGLAERYQIDDVSENTFRYAITVKDIIDRANITINELDVANLPDEDVKELSDTIEELRKDYQIKADLLEYPKLIGGHPAYMKRQKLLGKQKPFKGEIKPHTLKIANALADVRNNWENAPKVYVFDTQAELLKALGMKDEELPGKMQLIDAVYSEGTVYFAAENIPNTDYAITTLLHESFGHYGLKGVLGDQIDKVLSDVYRAKKEEIAKENFIKIYGLDLNVKEDQLHAAEEWLARVAQAGKKNLWINKIIGMIKKFIRKIMPGKMISDEEIMLILSDARAFVEKGGNAPRQKLRTAPAYSKERMADKWYSQMEQFIEQKLSSGPAGQVKQTLESWAKKGLIKSEELSWSGLIEWLDVQGNGWKIKEAVYSEKRGETGPFHNTWRVYNPDGDRLSRLFTSEESARGFIKKQGGKEDGQDKVTKEDVLNYLKENNVQLQEVVKGNSAKPLEWKDAGPYAKYTVSTNKKFKIEHLPNGRFGLISPGGLRDGVASLIEAKELAERYNQNSEAKETKFSQYQLPGGENYKEFFVTAPGNQNKAHEARSARVKELIARKEELERFLEKTKKNLSEVGRKDIIEDYQRQIRNTETQIDMAMRETRDPNGWKDGHGQYDDVENPVVRVRFNDRTGPNGEKILSIEEMQRPQAAEAKKMPPALHKNAYIMGFKRMVRYAAENGFDAIGWTGGQVQADRYDLSKQVESIDAQPQGNMIGVEIHAKGTGDTISFNVKDGVVSHSVGISADGKPLDEVVGKEMAEKILSIEKTTKFKGQDLKIGGEKLINLYDQMFPRLVNKFFNKPAWGKAKVGTVNIPMRAKDFASRNPDSETLRTTDPEKIIGGEEIWTLPITPEMKSKALREGMPMFHAKQKPDLDAWAKDMLKDYVKEIPKTATERKAAGEKPKKGDYNPDPSPFEKNKDDWFAEKDWAVYKNSVESLQLQKAIAEAVGLPKGFTGKTKELFTQKQFQKYKDYDAAIHIYLDLKRNPGHYEEFYADLTDEQKRIVDLSREIGTNKKLKAIADYIDIEYQKTGLEAMSHNIIHNTLDNYVARAWKISNKISTDNMQKFKTSSRHAKQRVFETILEGWSKGFELQISGATNNLNLLKDEIARTIEDKKLLRKLQSIETEEGNPFISASQLEGYEKIEHPNFKDWRPVEYIKGRDVDYRQYGKNHRVVTKWAAIQKGALRAKSVFDDEETAWAFVQMMDNPDEWTVSVRHNILEKKELYAPAEYARRLNKILGTSKLRGAWKIGDVSVIDTITKYNALLKAWILVTSFFHHLAFMRSYLFGTRHKSLHEWRPVKAYKEGMKMIEEMGPEIELLVRNGLTLGRMQDWEEATLRSEETIFAKAIDAVPMGHTVRTTLNNLRERQADFLFKRFGAGLKTQAALIEYRNALKEHPDMDTNDRAAMVARLINDDFGGLHLQRLERDPTVQHIFRLLALAPDWCVDSNTRAMTKTGWKYHHELSIDDEIMAFDPETKKLKWSRLKDKYVNEHYDGKMIQIKNFNRAISMTPDHKCYVYNFTTKRYDIVKANEIQTNHMIPRCAPFDAPDNETYDDFMVKMVGWLVTDGYVKKSTNKLADGSKKEYRYGKIVQSKPDMVSLLKEMNIAYHVDNNNSDHDKFVSNYKKHVFTIPNETFQAIENEGVGEHLTWEFLNKLTRRQQKLLYDTMFLGDGTGQGRFCGKEKEVFYMTMLQTLMGLPTTFYQQEENCWRTRIIRRSDKISCWGHHDNRSEITYAGTIWCPSVDTGFWLAEREGLMFITGNTESNVRTMVKIFTRKRLTFKDKKLQTADWISKEERNLYRKFWASVITKGILATFVANLLLSIGDDDDLLDKFKDAWESGNFKWLDVDITPIYKLLGGKKEGRKYFSLFGHFKDPLKFVFHPVRSAHHKGSVIYRTFHEAMTGEDWRGQRFTTASELMGIDDKGLYVTRRKGHHEIGDPKGGKLAGKLTAFSFESGGPISWEQIPSYLASQVRNTQPIQVQNLISYVTGETEGFDAIARSAGLHTSSSFKSEKAVLSDFAKSYTEIRREGKSLAALKEEVEKYNERMESLGEKTIPWIKIVRKGNKLRKAERMAENG